MSNTQIPPGNKTLSSALPVLWQMKSHPWLPWRYHYPDEDQDNCHLLGWGPLSLYRAWLSAKLRTISTNLGQNPELIGAALRKPSESDWRSHGQAVEKNSLVNGLFFTNKAFSSLLQTPALPSNSDFYDYLSLKWEKGYSHTGVLILDPSLT